MVGSLTREWLYKARQQGVEVASAFVSDLPGRRGRDK